MKTHQRTPRMNAAESRATIAYCKDPMSEKVLQPILRTGRNLELENAALKRTLDLVCRIKTQLLCPDCTKKSAKIERVLALRGGIKDMFLLST